MIPPDDVHHLMDSDLARRLEAGQFDPDEPEDLDVQGLLDDEEADVPDEE